MSGADNASWQTAPEFVEARNDEVHIWRAALDVLPSHVENLRTILSNDERERAARFHFERDRSRFIVGRAFLRILIGRYLQKMPSEIQLSYGANGKPFVAGQEEARFSFNLSHSGCLALYAVTRGREIGVDLERISALMNMEAIAERFFSAQEVAALKELSPDRRQKAFFTCWTRKEAYVKARGEGLSIPLDAFSVSLRPEDLPSLKVQGDPKESSRWSLLAIDPDPDYVGAVAVEGRAPVLRCWHCPGNLQTQSLSVAAPSGHVAD
jgi:4'-phosphopantetheinyl transferase